MAPQMFGKNKSPRVLALLSSSPDSVDRNDRRSCFRLPANGALLETDVQPLALTSIEETFHE
jgi:hypothetical protein